MSVSTRPSPPQFIYVKDLVPRGRFLQAWEVQRHSRYHLFVSCVAEMMGAFIYTYLGVGSTAAYVIGGLTAQTTLGSLLQVGFAYGFGIVLALVCCASTSGGHFSPGVTVVFALFKGFPKRKVIPYILAQTLGAYIACLLVYLQWKGLIVSTEALLSAAGTLDAIQFTPAGPAGIFAFYVEPGTNLGYVFANEFFVDFILGLAIWACLDPSNFFAPPAASPFIIGFAYSGVIWGFAPASLATNTARDLGGRFAAMSIWGTQAAGGPYAAITALTNFLAFALSACFYEFMFADTSRVLPPAQRDMLYGHKAHLDYVDTNYINATGMDRLDATEGQLRSRSSQNDMEKANVSHRESTSMPGV